MIRSFLFVLGLIWMLSSCGIGSATVIPTHSNAEHDAMFDIWLVTMEIGSNAHVGEPFSLIFTVTPSINARNETFEVRIPPSVELIEGVIYQTNLTITASTRYEIPLTLKINDATPVLITFVAKGGYSNGEPGFGELSRYLIEQNGVLVPAISIPDTRPTRAPNQPPPVDEPAYPLPFEPYITNDGPTPFPKPR